MTPEGERKLIGSLDTLTTSRLTIIFFLGLLVGFALRIESTLTNMDTRQAREAEERREARERIGVGDMSLREMPDGSTVVTILPPKEAKEAAK